MFSDLLLKERTLKVRKETSMLLVMVCIMEAGVFNFSHNCEDDSTILKFKSTDTQWKFINAALDMKDEIMSKVDMKQLEEIFKS